MGGLKGYIFINFVSLLVGLSFSQSVGSSIHVVRFFFLSLFLIHFIYIFVCLVPKERKCKRNYRANLILKKKKVTEIQEIQEKGKIGRSYQHTKVQTLKKIKETH